MAELRPLPVDEVLPSVAAGLREHRAVVLQAATGAGKTTRVPPALLRSGVAGRGRILVLQPRRVAARATAARMAAENGWSLGGEVGYRVRFDQRVGPQSRIVAVTEGVLLRMLRDDPFLQDVSVVVFDEFHERNLDSDLALGMSRQIQASVRDDLKILVMSATLAPEPVARYLGGCPVVGCEGRLFPVEIVYSPPTERRSLSEIVADGVLHVLERTEGHVLAFLPGLREIRQTRRRLDEAARRTGALLLELYGDLPPEQQDAVLEPSSQRKIILATNVAETSLTIEGVTAVVDSGWARTLRYDPTVGLDRLELTPISRASADQRAGRAGRTQPGLCWRLWHERSQHARPEQEEPEIRRVDVSGAILQVLNWIEPDVATFPWFEPPRPQAVERAVALLRSLGAADAGGVTELGRRLADLPIHPRLGRLLVEAERLGCLERAALGAALLSERSPLSPRTAAYHTRSDLLEQVTELEAIARGEGASHDEPGLERAAVRHVLRVRDQLVQAVAGRKRAAPAEHTDDEAFLHAVLAAFPDRLARRREPGGRRGLMVGGRGVRLANESGVIDGELFVCVDADGAGPEAHVRSASFVDRAWLHGADLREQVEVAFDPAAERVVARRRVYWQDLLLEETPAATPTDGRVAEVLLAAAKEHWERAFPADDGPVLGFVTRVRWLQRHVPELGLPALAEDDLRRLLPTVCAGRKSLADVRRGPWLAAVKGLLTPEQLRAVEREAPERLPVPSGRSVPLVYDESRPPVLAARIQEVFGLVETPRVARGRVAVLMHLLAPNLRVQQVTDDLRSFWSNVYPVVRKELRGRYPKHAWPEDPWQATAGKKNLGARE